jgi:hypothetical protein
LSLRRRLPMSANQWTLAADRRRRHSDPCAPASQRLSMRRVAKRWWPLTRAPRLLRDEVEDRQRRPWYPRCAEHANSFQCGDVGVRPVVPVGVEGDEAAPARGTRRRRRRTSDVPAGIRRLLPQLQLAGDQQVQQLALGHAVTTRRHVQRLPCRFTDRHVDEHALCRSAASRRLLGSGTTDGCSSRGRLGIPVH